MIRARSIQANSLVSPLFSAARIYMDFVTGFYIGRSASDMSGTPTVVSGSGLQATGAGNNASLTGTNFSSWFNATAGTFYVEFVQNAAGGGGFGRVFECNDGTTSEMFNMAFNGVASYTFETTDGAALQASSPIAIPAYGTLNKVACRFAVNDFRLCLNGTLGVPDTSGTLPTVTLIHLGNRVDGTRALDGFIRRFAFFPTALDNASMQSLTA